MTPIIDADLVRRLLAEQFPQWASLPLRPVSEGGWNNVMFRLGETMLVRLPRAERYAAAIAVEQRFLPWLGPQLPVPIPDPLGSGAPAASYPWPWSIYRWIDGETAARAIGPEDVGFARELTGLLAALHRIDAAGGPAPGPHNFFRGGSLSAYDGETRAALERLDDAGLRARASSVWNAALASEFRGPPVWVHGDFAPRNLLAADGRLAGVIDFGQLNVGDPACDLAIAWVFLRGAAREAFHDGVPLDAGTWARARGWTLWKALILATGLVDGPEPDIADAWRVVSEVLADHRRLGGTSRQSAAT